MPPRKKELPKHKQKGKPKAPEPQSENDFLEAADEHEQAAGKWRAGDAVKATRLFNRAIDMYNEGLRRYPQSFDLAYNKANLEFNLTEDDRIVPHLGNRNVLLAETLKSHRFAVSLNPENTDILFNTAQALTSLAEAQLEISTVACGKGEASRLLNEAVDIFTKCLESQQHEYTQIQAGIAQAQASGEYQGGWEGERHQSADAEEDPMDTTPSTSEETGDWATVEEPLTPESILETCTAQLTAITTLLGLYDPEDLSSIEKKAQDGLETAQNRIPALIELATNSPTSHVPEEPKAGPTLSIGSIAEDAATSTKDDAILAAGAFQASIAEMTHRSSKSTSAEYAQAIEHIFSSLNTTYAPCGPTPTLAALNIHSAHADALIDLASAISDTRNTIPASASDQNHDLDLQWTTLSRAQTILTELTSPPCTKLLTASRLASIFLARGDVDLSRFRIASLDSAKPTWGKSKAVLVANAGVFYRGARGYAERCGAMGASVRRAAETKAIVAEMVGSGNVVCEEWRGKGKSVQWREEGEAVVRVLQQMAEEGVLSLEIVNEIVAAMG